MKRLLISTLLVLFAFTLLVGQTGFRTMNANSGLPEGQVSISQVSLHNAWFGSAFSYRLTGDADFNENFLFNANVLYNIPLGESGWNVPVVGNVQLPITGESFEDLEVGLYPWKVLSQSQSGVIIVGHGGVSYSVNPASEADLSPQTFTVLAGAEVSVPFGDNNLPLTLSLTPVFNSRNLDQGNNFGLEGTFILPIAGNLGVIGELEVPFDSDFDTSFSAGVLVNGAIGGSNR